MGSVNPLQTLTIKELGRQDYQIVWQAMQDFTKARTNNTKDELWVVEHPSVYTLGRNGKEEHILRESNIPIMKVDRGGQVTYHGPGQLVVYLLLDLHRRKLGVRQLVTIIENSLIALLKEYSVIAQSDSKAPGVYVDNKKIAALGLRVSKGFTTHGLSLNVDMSLQPFNNINTCGYKGLEVTQCADLGVTDNMNTLSNKLVVLIQDLLLKDSYIE